MGKFGWAWVKDEDVFNRMSNYISVTTQAYPVSELIYGTRILQMILDEGDYFERVQNILMERCKAIEKVFKDGGDKFVIDSPCGGMFILVKCMDIDSGADCE